MVPVLVFFGVSAVVGFLIRGFLWLRLRAVVRRLDVSDGALCELRQAGRISSIAVVASAVGLAVIGLMHVIWSSLT